jgi:hypothetical protein
MHYKSSDPYALGRQAFKRHLLARAYGQSEVAALAALSPAFQSEFSNRTPLPPVWSRLTRREEDI